MSDDLLMIEKAFHAKDEIVFGPFRASWKYAQHLYNTAIYVNDKPVRLSNVQTNIMTLLIGNQGQPVTHLDFGAFLGGGKSRNFYEIFNDKASLEKEREEAMDALANNMKVTISHIRSAIRKALDNEEEYDAVKNWIVSVNPPRNKGRPVHVTKPEMHERGYMLKPTIYKGMP